jgi:hypothetical protein
MPKPLWQDFKICYRSRVNMEGAGHPLQSLADAITMEEFKTDHRPKVVLSWAPPKSTTSSCRQFFCANDAIARRRFCHYTSGRLRTQSEITKDSRLSTIRIKHLKMLILSTLKTGAVTKITVKSLITILNGLLQQIK